MAENEAIKTVRSEDIKSVLVGIVFNLLAWKNG